MNLLHPFPPDALRRLYRGANAIACPGVFEARGLPAANAPGRQWLFAPKHWNSVDVLSASPYVDRTRCGEPTGGHTEYDSPHFLSAAVMRLLCLTSTTVSPPLSTLRWVRVSGALTLLSFGAAYYFHATWFTSVWCFSSALLNAVVYVHFALRPTACNGAPQRHGIIR